MDAIEHTLHSCNKIKFLDRQEEDPLQRPWSGLWMNYGGQPGPSAHPHTLPSPLVTQFVEEQLMQRVCKGRMLSPARPDPRSPFFFQIKMEMCYGCLSQTPLPGRTWQGLSDYVAVRFLDQKGCILSILQGGSCQHLPQAGSVACVVPSRPDL